MPTKKGLVLFYFYYRGDGGSDGGPHLQRGIHALQIQQ